MWGGGGDTFGRLGRWRWRCPSGGGARWECDGGAVEVFKRVGNVQNVVEKSRESEASEEREVV